ncbi:hypothetical protein, partial [Methylobacterium sp. SI9]|uniref:hypothetical protein n=1 Tax=Methylobacterium guangdongense TaxID=3138811 RepID=UPI00313A97C8
DWLDRSRDPCPDWFGSRKAGAARDTRKQKDPQRIRCLLAEHSTRRRSTLRRHVPEELRCAGLVA